MLGTLAFITLAACYLLAPVSGSGVGTNKALSDTTGAQISTQTHTNERMQKHDKCEAAAWSVVQCLDPLSSLGC